MSSRCRNLARCRQTLIAGLLAFALTGAGCQQDQSAARQAPPGGDRMEGVRQVTLRPGQTSSAFATSSNPLGSDPQVLKDGERLYKWMNCIGCHFEGGGGIGPPLMDDDWIYGGSPAQIFDSVVNGRANGMPAFGDRLAADEIWRIVAFVETLNPDRETSDPQKPEQRDEGGEGGR